MNEKSEALRKYDFLYDALADKRGLDITALYLGEDSYVSDVFILVTANSDIHMGTLRDAVLEALHAHGFSTSVEGRESLRWCLVDAGEVAVHIFSTPGREQYKLDKLWGDAPSYRHSYRE